MADIPSTTPPKKGLPGMAIAGIGCGGLLLCALIGGGMLVARGCSKVLEVTGDFQKYPVTAGARLIVAMNPNLELIKADETTKEITIKDKQTGQVMTMSLDELQQGKFKVSDGKGNETTVESSSAGQGRVVVKGPEGETVIGGSAADTALPSWVPGYPGAASKQGGMRVAKGDKLSGMTMAESPDPVGKVKDFYEARLKAAGFKTETTVTNSGGNDSAIVSATKDDGKQTVSLVIASDGAKTSIMLNYEGPK